MLFLRVFLRVLREFRSPACSNFTFDWISSASLNKRQLKFPHITNDYSNSPAISLKSIYIITIYFFIKHFWCFIRFVWFNSSAKFNTRSNKLLAFVNIGKFQQMILRKSETFCGQISNSHLVVYMAKHNSTNNLRGYVNYVFNIKRLIKLAFYQIFESHSAIFQT